VACAGERLGHQDVEAVITDIHGGEGAADNFADKYSQAAENCWKMKPANVSH
jgi:hypothetical protein